MNEHNHRYEVALSFAGEQREYVRAVNDYLKARQVKTFYDEDQDMALWGKNHTEELPRIYARDSLLVVMFVSEQYVEKRWPRHERRAILTEQTQREGQYLLPVEFDDVPVPGLDPAIHRLKAEKFDPERLAKLICQQLVELGVREPEPSGFQINLTNLRAGGEDLDPAQLPRPLCGLISRTAKADPESIRRVLNFGTSQPIVVGPEGLTSVSDIGSPEAGSQTRIVLEAQGHDALVGHRLTLTTIGDDGQPEQSFHAAVSHGGTGGEGWSLESSLLHGLHTTFCLPKKERASGETLMRLNVCGLDPATARQASRTYAALRAAPRLRLAIDGALLAEIGQSMPVDNLEVQDALSLAEAAEDLMIVQNSCGVHFPMPEKIAPQERLWLRTWRLVIEGKAAPVPRRSFRGVASPDLADDSIREEGTFLLYLDGTAVSVSGVPLAFPDYAVYHPNVRITGLRESRDDVRNGLDKPRQFEVRTSDGTPFAAYIPDRIGPDVIRTSPWALTGAEEPAALMIPRGTDGSA